MTSEADTCAAALLRIEDQLDALQLELARVVSTTDPTAPGMLQVALAVNLICRAELYLLSAAKEMKR